MTRRKRITVRTGATARSAVRRRRSPKSRGRNAVGWTTWISRLFGRSRVTKRTGRKGWWLN